MNTSKNRVKSFTFPESYPCYIIWDSAGFVGWKNNNKNNIEVKHHHGKAKKEVHDEQSILSIERREEKYWAQFLKG